MRVTQGAEGEWFRRRVSRVLGEGEDTLFWEDVWAWPLGGTFEAETSEIFSALCGEKGYRVI